MDHAKIQQQLQECRGRILDAVSDLDTHLPPGVTSHVELYYAWDVSGRERLSEVEVTAQVKPQTER